MVFWYFSTTPGWPIWSWLVSKTVGTKTIVQEGARLGKGRCREAPLREASAAIAAPLCAGHAQQFGGASPPANLMEVKA
jgi:hypothetical protein